MAYTVKQLSKLAGVSVRTLHHYDEIGLLKPAYRKNNDYRFYENPELTKLQQILFFKELGFSLPEIKAILESKDFEVIEALKEQKEVLRLKTKRLEKLRKTITNTINSMNKKIKINEEDLFESFSEEQIEKYKEEVRKKYGEKTLKQSEERTKGWTKKDFENAQREGEAILKIIAENIELGVSSNEVQAQIKEYHHHIEKFYDCSLEIFEGLGEMYVTDERFKKYFERIQKGLAEFVKESIKVYCKKESLKK